jgi:glycosyltransferase involved in cell wall biosynthesis
MSVSVIIPHYQHGGIIRRQVEALKRQTHPADEIIVVDDGSSPATVDEVAAVVEDLPGARLEVTGVNCGAAAACNTGLALASGEFVCFPAADDELLPRFIACGIRDLEDYPAAAFCFSDPAIVQPATGKVRRFPFFFARQPRFFSPSEMEKLLAHSFFTFPTNAILFRRDPVLAAGGFRTGLGSHCDAFLDYVLALRHGAVYRPEVLGHIYEDPDSYSSRQRRSAAIMRNITRAFLEILQAPDHSDVRASFRRAGIMPEHSWRVVRWLLADARGRSYLTTSIAMRCLANTPWLWMRRWVPGGLRDLLRQAANITARS